MGKTSIAALAQSIYQRAQVSGQVNRTTRHVVGIAGPPAAGKSTLAGCLRDEINNRWGRIAEIAPMDGFHLTNRELADLGALERKGEPDTFAADAFADSLCAVRQGAVVAWPTYDRSLHDPVPGGVVFDHNVKIAITEGNYLFLDAPGWSRVRPCLDEARYLDAEIETIEDRLIRRHMTGGKSREWTMVKVSSSDLPNARLIATTRTLAQMVLREEAGGYTVIEDSRPDLSSAPQL